MSCVAYVRRVKDVADPRLEYCGRPGGRGPQVKNYCVLL